MDADVDDRPEAALDSKARSRFAAMLDVPQAMFEIAFARDGKRITSAYYRHVGNEFDCKEFATKMNLGALCCITVFAIPLALPFIGAMAYMTWTVRRKMVADRTLLRSEILASKR